MEGTTTMRMPWERMVIQDPQSKTATTKNLPCHRLLLLPRKRHRLATAIVIAIPICQAHLIPYFTTAVLLDWEEDPCLCPRWMPP